MPVRKADAQWNGNLRNGKGTVRLGSGAFEGRYSFTSRFEEGTGTNPEELIAAAHAGCYSMALSAGLEAAGFAPEQVHTTAQVKIEKDQGGFSITAIHLVTKARVPKIDEETFNRHAEDAKTGCPVSKALASVAITLDATLE
jgi:lipoyl-dependent peroxiredoxin